MTVKLSGPMLPPKSGGAPRQLMVLLHGYGADGRDLIGLGMDWRERWPDMLFAAPNAPEPCAQNPGGFQWFPLNVDRIAGRIEGTERARPVIVTFLEEVWAQTSVTPENTVLAGFSQGAIMALDVGLSLDRTLAAIVSFSGALVRVEPPAAKPPVALIHGEFDHVVETSLSRDAAREMTAHGLDVHLHISPGIGHGIAPDGLDFATAFLAAKLGPGA